MTIRSKLRRPFGRQALSLAAALTATVCTAGLIAFTAPSAEAGPRSYASLNAPSHTAPALQSKSVVIPYAKSTVVDLPADAQDIFIADPNIVRALTHTARRVMLIGSQPGQTNAYFYGAGGTELLSMDIRVERDTRGLVELIGEHAPSARVDVEPINNNLLLTGSVPNAATANRVQRLAEMWLDENTAGGGDGEVVNLLAVEGRDQVMLKVRIVEMQRSVTKQLGINLNTVARLGDDATVSLFSNNGLSTGAGFFGNFDWLNNNGGDIRSVGGALQALERVGLVRTLAEPTLTAISGETASFLSGGEFPLLTRVFFDDAGRLQRGFEFKPFGVSVGFTPVVLSEGRISLSLSTEVSEPTTEGSFETGGISSDILGLRVRRAESTVEMPAGGSLVIAGLIREETRQNTDGVPGLKDVPALGAAFRNRDDQTSQQELLIIVTPYLVEATHPDKLQTPLDGFETASDKDVLLTGRRNRITAEDASGASQRLGPFGHIVD